MLKKIINSLGFLIFAALLAAMVYGGLSIYKLKAENTDLNNKLETLADKVDDFQQKLADTQTNFDKVNTESQTKITDLEGKLASYRSLAMAPKEILGAQTQAPAPIAEIKPAVVETKTIIKTVQAPVKKQASVIVQGIGSFKVDLKSGDTAFTVLKRAATANGFDIKYDNFSFGVFVTEIGGIKPVGNQYWAFYYNGRYSNVGASDQKISNGDTVFWRLETF